MIRHLQRAAVVLGLLLGLASSASAQSACSYIAYGVVMTAAQWNECFQLKQDALGFIPLPVTGGTMTGPLITAVPTTSAAEFNLPPGAAPTSPNNGDVWSTTAGLYAQVNGVTVGPLASTSSSVVQTINLNSAPLPTRQTGTILQLGQANGVTARVELDAFAAVPRYTCVREDGTAAFPTTIQAADELCSLNAFGYNGATIAGPQAALRTYASQNWNTGANGTYLRLGTTPNGTTTLTDALGIEQDGGVTIGTTLGTSEGAGTINLSGGLYKSGTAAAIVINGVTCTLFSTCSVTATSTSVTVGATTIVSGTPNGILFDNAGVIGNSTTLPSAVQANITALGTIATGVWNGTAVAAAYLPTATSAALGLVEGDGSTLPISAGVMHCVTATTSQIGCAKPDGSTIVITSGVLSAIGAAAASISVGVTSVNSGTTGYVLYDNGGTLGQYAIPLSSAIGGTGVASPAAHTLPVNEGSSAQNNTGTGSAGQCTVSGGTSADPSFVSGCRVLLATYTASSSATVGNSSIFSGYNDYEVVYEKMVPTGNAFSLVFQVYVGSYQTTGYFTQLTNFRGTTVVGQAETAGLFMNAGDLSNTSSYGGSGTIFIYGAASGQVQLFGQSSYYNTSGTASTQVSSGFYNSGSPVTGFQFLMTSGNIASGTVKVYGKL